MGVFTCEEESAFILEESRGSGSSAWLGSGVLPRVDMVSLIESLYSEK